jgi:isoquinoline 1-oxidoreductase beta subunit
VSSAAPHLSDTGGVEIIIDRRKAVLGGGLLLGFMFAESKAWGRINDARVNPKGPQAVSNEEVTAVAGSGFVGFAPDAFIRIAHDNQITLIIPNVEMGQGIYTGEAMLIAEELEVGLDQIHVVPAPPDDVLYMQPLLQFQGTGGSTSIRGAWDPLRKAGAAARVMLIGAAAARWGVSPEECFARGAAVFHQPTGRSLPYGRIVDDASRRPKPTQVQLKPVSEFRLLGRKMRRVDTPSKVNGTARYGIDIMVPGMKIATVKNCPVPGGMLASVDEAPARAIAGVIQVIRLPSAIAVVADHFWAAKTGLDALQPKWIAGRNANLSSAALWADLDRASQAGRGAVAVRQGDPDASFDRADTRIEAIYRQPFLAHAPMEPMAAVVHVQGGKAEVWCGTQVPTRAQAEAAKVLGMPKESVSIYNQLIGGGFGRKLETDYVVQACQIAKNCPFPVKMIWTREEDIQHDNFRPMYVDRISAGLDGDGRPVAWRHRITAASVTARFAPAGMRPNGVDPDAVEEAEDPVYGRFPNMLVDYVKHDAPPGLTVSWWRGVGPTHNIFVIESFIDELAHAAGKDPFEYRRDLLRDQPRARAVLERAAQESGWGTPLPPGVGRGIIVQKCFGSYLSVVVEAGVSDEGDVTLRHINAAVDCGLTVNPSLVKQQVEGGILFGLSAALYSEITFENGRVRQSNFHDYRILRIDETPPTIVHHMLTGNPPGGIGETGTTAAAPALCNAIFAATGVRLRQLPVDRTMLRKDARHRSNGATLVPAALVAGAALLKSSPGRGGSA